MLSLHNRKSLLALLGIIMALLLLATLNGCASRTQQVRHLDANLSILTPGMSEREVRAVLGPPDRVRAMADGGEQWLYLEVHQSRMKRNRLLGSWLGHEFFHQATVTIRDGQLVDAIYRGLDRQEFLELGGEIP